MCHENKILETRVVCAWILRRPWMLRTLSSHDGIFAANTVCWDAAYDGVN